MYCVDFEHFRTLLCLDIKDKNNLNQMKPFIDSNQMIHLIHRGGTNYFRKISNTFYVLR